MTHDEEARVPASDHEAAATMAEEAGRLLLGVRARGLAGDALKQAGDAESHTFLMAALARRFPDDAILSEEGSQDGERVGRRRAWIVDPLDGTREFSEPPRDDWAVHVALVIDGLALVGAVALPARGLTLSTAAPPPPPPAHGGRPRLLVSRSRPTEHAERLARRLDAELVPMGSAGAKAMAVVLGDGDIYAHSGGQYEWDSAAPVAVAAAVGMHVSRLDGSPLVYNQPDPWLPDLLVCRPELAEAVIAICREDGG
jgi:3'(2'), 5'-bisphosphate nucleotidase